MRRRVFAASRALGRGAVFTLGGTVLAGLLFSAPAVAESKTDRLIKQLQTSDDFRVRTQAALALGASRDGAALDPLCKALSDSENSVKVAAAAALGKLGKADGVKCLKTAKSREKDKDVVAQIEQSISKLSGGGNDPPPVTSETKIYLAIEVTNKTSRPSSEIDALVRSAIQSKVIGNSTFAVAPKGESADKSGQIVKSKHLKGYLLIAAVNPPSYKGGSLTVTVDATMWTYPDKALKAQFSPKLTQEGTPSTDTEGENILMKMGSEKAAESFMKVAASL